MTAPWITYRPELKVLDCTIRDGGLVNDHNFSDDFVRATYQANVEAGIDYMEIGYKNSRKLFPKDQYGPWKRCDEEDIRRIVGENDTPLKLTVMCDAGKSDWKTDVLHKSESVLDMIRVAFYAHQASEAVDMIHDAAEKGYEVSGNLMAVSTTTEKEVDQVLEVLAQTPVNVVIVVDSFGSLYAEQIEILVKKYLEYCKPAGKEVGVHAHNNQQLAFANTIEGIIHGANRVDASMGGLGRGAGNCPMELIIGFLRNPKFKIRPIYRVLEECLVPLSREVEWGPYPQYNITGQRNEHPRTAIAARSGEDRDKYVEFFDKLNTEV
ncbi:MAG: nucleoid-structuring protein H-NS [Planctomycetes bacterium RBG_13_63_9]|nr:MAG: nucleoid-structuring protein H-NS [Planctomycetes bacterium RBG_13_63_9]